MAHATVGKFVSDYDIQNLNQKQRLELLRSLESVGLRSVGELGEMVDSDRCKWLFWNLHENFDAIRLMEPTLQACITSMQFTIQDNLTLHGADIVDKRLDFSCTWHLQLTYPGSQDEISHTIGNGWINLAIAQALPPYPFLGQGQKAFLDADHTVYPSQLFLDGLVSRCGMSCVFIFVRGILLVVPMWSYKIMVCFPLNLYLILCVDHQAQLE